MDALYEAVAHATGEGRNGHARTDDGMLDLDVRVPTELGGPGGATNPEQLFAAGLAVELDVSIPNLDRETALRVTEDAHKVCPYSNATRGNIEVKLAVV